MIPQTYVWVLVEQKGIDADGVHLGPHYWFTTEEKAEVFVKDREILYPHLPRLMLVKISCLTPTENATGGCMVTQHDVVIVRVYGAWCAVPVSSEYARGKLLWHGVVFRLAS